MCIRDSLLSYSESRYLGGDFGMIFNQKITLDLTIDRVQNVHCSQDDDESRKILITLSDKGKPYTVPTNSVIHLKISKPDGTFVYIDEDDTSHLFRNTRCV